MQDPARKERRVVTVLFADMVGFTARAEELDPEDVQELLEPYHTRLRTELERYGGVVEKFIGDAVVGVFGAPVAHEDDAERAVRAALAIRDWAAEQDSLKLRIAVCTGEALVLLEARPEMGQGMVAGDVVNTAARLQAAAPANGILVGEGTYRTTRDAIEYQQMEPVHARGKSALIPSWEAVSLRPVRARSIKSAPLIGRQEELGLMLDALARARAGNTSRVTALIGPPGIGKSRLLHELFQRIDPDSVLWRQGRCLPYGDGVTYWALAEMVKVHAGILETDSAEEVTGKIEAIAGSEGWIARHLLPLVGVVAEEDMGGDQRGAAFAAWRLFFESLAREKTLVLVFEDLHWADDDLLDFVDSLTDWEAGCPILVIVTARPELLDRRPEWKKARPGATTTVLGALSDSETMQLVSALTERPENLEEVRSVLLERAAGNPLYTEEFIRLGIERGSFETMPETVQGIIAARLDAVAREEKAVLQDAAVMGKIFWSAALVGMSGAPRTAVEKRLEALEHRDLIARRPGSSIGDEAEYAFSHVVVKDVAYAQIPRAARAKKHAAAAEWLESFGRPEDQAEMLAHHYSSALELSLASGADTQGLTGKARRALRDAGDRASSLNAYASAARFFTAALELWPEDASRPALLFDRATALFNSGDEDAEEALGLARDALLAVGDRARAAESEAMISRLWFFRGQRDEVRKHMEKGRRLVEAEPASAAKTRVLALFSSHLMLTGENGRAIAEGRAALSMATALGLDEMKAHILTTVGAARVGIGDLGGIADLERSVETAAALSSPELGRAYNNLAGILDGVGHISRSREVRVKGVRASEQLGLVRSAHYQRAALVNDEFYTGAWADFMIHSQECRAKSRELGGNLSDLYLLGLEAFVLVARSQEEKALEVAREALQIARDAGDPQATGPALANLSWVEGELELREGPQHARECLQILEPHAFLAGNAVPIGLVADRLGVQAEVRTLADSLPGEFKWVPILRFLADGTFAQAADLLAAMDRCPSEAYARLRAAELLKLEGSPSGVKPQAEKALAFWRSVDASRFITRSEDLLSE